MRAPVFIEFLNQLSVSKSYKMQVRLYLSYDAKSTLKSRFGAEMLVIYHYNISKVVRSITT